MLTRKGKTIGHIVYRKPTQTELYLHRKSNHHSLQKYRVTTILTEREKRTYGPKTIISEIKQVEYFTPSPFSTKYPNYPSPR